MNSRKFNDLYDERSAAIAAVLDCRQFRMDEWCCLLGRPHAVLFGRSFISQDAQHVVQGHKSYARKLTRR